MRSWRAACAALNARRTSGLFEISQEASRREQVSANVWSDALARRLTDSSVPRVSIERLGISIDKDGFLESKFLRPLTAGAEAAPFLDEEHKVVYKLFDVRANGSLGKKLST